MENTYNVKISFKGEGSFAFTLPGHGDLTVYANKDIFVKGLNVSGVELLRQLRPLKLEHQLNAKPDGCYKVIDLTNQSPVKHTFESIHKEPAPISVADLKASMIKTTGPIDPNEGKEVVEESKPEIIEETKSEESKVEAPKVNKPAPKTTNKPKAKSGKKKNSRK